jgi:endonuclease YncB( thermonuclease family)
MLRSKDPELLDRFLHFALLLAGAGAVLPSTSLSGEAQQPLVVAGEAAAVDGDTLVVDGHRIRIRALHAPEVSEPGGVAAKEMAALAIYGEQVVCTVVNTDPFGRLEADCIMSSDGADFAEVMIRAGRADHCPAHGRPDLASLPDNGFRLPADCRWRLQRLGFLRGTRELPARLSSPLR